MPICMYYIFCIYRHVHVCLHLYLFLYVCLPVVLGFVVGALIEFVLARIFVGGKC